MANGTRAFVPGLEGVPVAETVLSWVDGEHGRLVLAGKDVEDIALRATFEEVAASFLAAGGEPPTAEDVRAAVGTAREAAYERLAELGTALDATDAMDALRAAMAHLVEDRRPGLPPFLAAAKLVGAAPVFAAAWARKRAGLSPVKPDRGMTHAADFLRMLRGTPATAEEIRALDTYLVTVIDHGLNASTFAARVVASTGSDLVSAVTAAISALKGPLHGGAPGPVLDMLDAVGEPAHAAEWLGSELDARRRIMGMGHRVYRTRDPRAAVLEIAVERLHAAVTGGGADSHAAKRLELARAVEREATALLAARHPNRALRANVEFYTAVLLEALAVPRELFSAVFAVARTVGWTAHVEEERRKGRLIRPTSIYVGAVPAAHSTKSRSLP